MPTQPPRTARVNMLIAPGAQLEYLGPPPLEGQLAAFHPHFWKGFEVLKVGANLATTSPDYIHVCMQSTPIDATFPLNNSWQVLKRADWRVVGYAWHAVRPGLK